MAKSITGRVLQEPQNIDTLPHRENKKSLKGLLSQARTGDYLAIAAYFRQTSKTDGALADLRRKVTERYGIATTVGYGPRYLHSTGQLHKGGPDNCLFLQLAADHTRDVEVPGEAYTFGLLADAQALGDLQALLARGPGPRGCAWRETWQKASWRWSAS